MCLQLLKMSIILPLGRVGRLRCVISVVCSATLGDSTPWNYSATTVVSKAIISCNAPVFNAACTRRNPTVYKMWLQIGACTLSVGHQWFTGNTAMWPAKVHFCWYHTIWGDTLWFTDWFWDGNAWCALLRLFLSRAVWLLPGGDEMMVRLRDFLVSMLRLHDFFLVLTPWWCWWTGCVAPLLAVMRWVLAGLVWSCLMIWCCLVDHPVLLTWSATTTSLSKQLACTYQRQFSTC